MSDRLTRKEIKRDEVMEGLSRVVAFVTANLRALGLGLVGVLALLAGYAVWQSVGSHREEAANESLSAALEGVSDPVGGLSAAEDDLVQVAERYGRTKAGSMAYAYLGTLAAQAEDFDAARENWTRFLAVHNDHALAAGIERNLISLDRAQGNSEALAQRLRASLASGDSALGPDSMLYELALTLEELGQTEGALEMYTRLLDEHPTSVFATKARERSSALETT